jgi:hypothetical protein
METEVMIKLLANCGCGLVLRAGQGKCFAPTDVITEAAAHSGVTGHKMEFYGQIIPPAEPVFIPDKSKDKRYRGRDYEG